VGERWSADIWGRPGQCRPPCGLRGAVGPLGGAITHPGARPGARRWVVLATRLVRGRA